jgi:hypothetical protein
MAQLYCHCSTAYRLGAEPAPVPSLFPDENAYLRIIDEEGRLWLWRLDQTVGEVEEHQSDTLR